jgi:hypothetical protein
MYLRVHDPSSPVLLISPSLCLLPCSICHHSTAPSYFLPLPSDLLFLSLSFSLFLLSLLIFLLPSFFCSAKGS